MIAKNTTRLIFASPLIAVLAACGGGTADENSQEAADAHEIPPEIELRHDNFEAIGDAFKAIRSQLEKQSPDMAVIQTSATEINERAQNVPNYFPKGTSVEAGYDTEALAAIWEKPEEFSKAANNLIAASNGLKTVSETGDVAAVRSATKILGGTCKACHDKFRVDDD